MIARLGRIRPGCSTPSTEQVSFPLGTGRGVARHSTERPSPPGDRELPKRRALANARLNSPSIALTDPRPQAFSIETAGAFDRDAELDLRFSGLGKVCF